ncbi:MAG: dihydroneopterin aldolase [Chloroflexi bacterium]|nr:dihydroneopterin aldolase [Chloroflexota bacterium]
MTDPRATDRPLDRIQIIGLRLNCVIGLNEWERLVQQEVVIDITVHADTRRAGVTDEVAETVNYRTVNKKVIEHVTGSQYKLVEALAENVARLCLAEPGVRRVDVSVRKPRAVRHADSVGVEITRFPDETGSRPEERL